MYQQIKSYVPVEWGTGDRASVNRNTEEFKQIEFEVRQAIHGTCPDIRNIIRVQDVHSFGQFLLREQLVLSESSEQLYRVRRYIAISKNFLTEVLKYNVDPRRCGLGSHTKLRFSNSLESVNSNNIVCITRVLTRNPNQAVITPMSSTEYYLEYIVEF